MAEHMDSTSVGVHTLLNTVHFGDQCNQGDRNQNNRTNDIRHSPSSRRNLLWNPQHSGVHKGGYSIAVADHAASVSISVRWPMTCTRDTLGRKTRTYIRITKTTLSVSLNLVAVCRWHGIVHTMIIDIPIPHVIGHTRRNTLFHISQTSLSLCRGRRGAEALYTHTPK